MNPTVINLGEKLSEFSARWSPKIVAQMNDYHFKLVKARRDFVWHTHANTDEVFLILEGELSIEFRDGSVTLKEGEMLVIPKGIEHKPCAEEECHLMLVEPAGTINSGDAGGDLTSDGEWI